MPELGSLKGGFVDASDLDSRPGADITKINLYLWDKEVEGYELVAFIYEREGSFRVGKATEKLGKILRPVIVMVM